MWQHQQDAFKFVLPKRGAFLLLPMGTGKTRVALALIFAREHKRVLVIAPHSVVENDVWTQELQLCHPNAAWVTSLKHDSVKARTDEMKRALQVAGAHNKPLIVVTNYEGTWRSPFAESAVEAGFDCLILDESHRIKAAAGVASRYLGRLAARIPYRLGLTGTLMPHSFLDVYAQFRAVDPYVFGRSYNTFKHRYGVWGGYGGYELKGVTNKEELQDRIYGISFRVGEDVLDLPPFQVITLRCTMGEQADRIYNSLESDFIANVKNGTVTAANALTRLLRLQQCTSGYVRTDDGLEAELDDAKFQLMLDTVEGTAPEEPWVIFCRFRHDLKKVHEMAHALGRGSLELSGSRDELARWKAEEAPILAVQIQAGKEGNSYVRTRYCGYFSLGFSLGDYLQSQKRVHRPGQTRPVTYYHWLARDTVDETVIHALAHRLNVVESILQRIKDGQSIDEALRESREAPAQA